VKSAGTKSDPSNNTSTPDELLTTMMHQMMMDATNNAGLDDINEDEDDTESKRMIHDMLSNMNEDEFLGRFMQEIQTKLQSELAHINHETTTVGASHATTTASAAADSRRIRKGATSTKSVTTPLSKQRQQRSQSQSSVGSLATTPANNTTNTNTSEVELVISNMVHSLTEKIHQNNDDDDDDDDDDISELDDLPDMDELMKQCENSNYNNNEEDGAMVQQLMENLIKLGSNVIDESGRANNNNNSHNGNTRGSNSSNNPIDTTTDLAADTILDGMMEQLLSKDIMYEPMIQVATKFPLWLQEHRSTLSTTEYERYRSIFSLIIFYVSSDSVTLFGC
jgi:Pex19 protein family